MEKPRLRMKVAKKWVRKSNSLKKKKKPKLRMKVAKKGVRTPDSR